MREERLLVAVKRSCRTTASTHHDGRYPTLLRWLEIVRPNQVWCADGTYIRLREECIYLASDVVLVQPAAQPRPLDRNRGDRRQGWPTPSPSALSDTFRRPVPHSAPLAAAASPSNRAIASSQPAAGRGS
jgi:hypothetical protein